MLKAERLVTSRPMLKYLERKKKFNIPKGKQNKKQQLWESMEHFQSSAQDFLVRRTWTRDFMTTNKRGEGQ